MTRLTTLLLTFTLILSAASGLYANEIDYIIKVISQIDSYISWADDKKFEGNGDKMVISAVGESELVAAVKKLSRTSSATGKTIKVRVVEASMIPSNSHILLLDISDSVAVAKITDKLRGSGTLVICHGKGLSSAGPSLNFVSVDGSSKPIMELNVAIAKAEGLSIKPALLKIAKVVK